ncbi:hypothetical protein [uncultured Adlercreutzia sp.]|uniref:hypothetical protein n=1 Tax=uncultured Adlercreutzia sp. TaxID=875803 RepID=UPI0026756534|nr:hypothetical protein [uncultured Adlercreutzia sp.]
MRKTNRSAVLRAAMAAVLACGLMMPVSAPAAYADEENAPTPPLASEIDPGGDFDGAVSDAGAGEADVEPSVETEPEDAPDGAARAASLGAQHLERVARAAASTEANEPSAQADGGTTAGGFTVSGGKAATSLTAGDGDFFFDGATLHILTSTPLTVSTPAQTAHTIQIDAGVKADLTLAGVTIATSTASPINMITNSDEDGDGVKVKNANQIKDKTSLYLTLADGSTNTLSVSPVTAQWPAIRCGWGSVLVIDDSITNVKAGGSKFNLDDIVTPVNGMVGTDATLLGGQTVKAGDALSTLEPAQPGKLVAAGGYYSSGIGSGPKENAGTLVINGGDISTSVYLAVASESNGSGLGAGSGGSGTVITINGGKVDARGGYCGTGIGAALGYLTTSANMACTAKADAIEIPDNEADSGSFSWYGPAPATSEYYTANQQYVGSDHYHSVAGDITLNGGFVKATNGGHGNAFGQSCAHGPASNKDHVILVTGGTLLTTVTYGSAPPQLFSIGARLGYTIITGGSVQCEASMFQGIGDTAFNTQGISSWADVERVTGGDPNDPDVSKRTFLPDSDKVQMLTIDLSSEFNVGENKTVPVTKWKLEIDNQAQNYGSPSYLDDGKLYLWLPESATGKNVTVTMSYRDAAGVEHDIEPMYVEEVGGDQGSVLKRYIDIDVEKLTDEQKEYFSDLNKPYDGLPFEMLTVSKEKPIDTTPFETNGKLLDDPEKIEVSYQAYDSVGGSPLPGSEVVREGKMPADTGTFRFQLVSKQFAETPGFQENYWGHRITGWSSVTPVPAVVKIAEKDGTAWVRLKKVSDDAYDYELVKETDAEPGNRLRVAFTVRSAKGTAVTCKAPTGSFQVLIDGKPVGEPVALTKEAVEASAGSTFAIQEGATEASANTPSAVAGEAGRWETQVVYYLDPTRLDGALDVLETSGQGNEHKVTVQYIPDKNYVEGTEANPDNEASKPTTIVPVKPEGTVTPDDPDKVEVTDTPNPTPDPDNPTGKMQVVRKTINVSYGDFHKADAEVDDFFKMAITSSSSAPGGFTTSNTAVADLVRGEDGSPALDEDGKLQIQVNSCGTSVITLEQKANALFTGIKYILTVNVRPDPSIKPQVQIRLTWRNLTALGEAAPEPAAALMARGAAALAAGEGEAFASAARSSAGRSHTPPRPGDVIEYTVTGLNLTPGSAWQGAELADAIDSKLAFDADSVEIAANYATRTDKSTSLGSDAFYEGFDWDGLAWSDVKQGDFSYVAPTLTKGVGTVYGGQSTSVRFCATVSEDEGLGDRPEDGKLPEITNEPAGSGGYGKDEADLAPGEEAVPPTKLVPDVDIVVVGEGDKDPETGKFPPDEPTPVLPKDPAAADIVTTVTVEQKEKGDDHGDDRFLVGDTLTVTVTATNQGPDSKLADAVIKATLPEGMEPKPGTIKLVDAEGNVHDVPDSAYDPKTGVIAVNGGDLYFGESAKLIFDVEVTSTPETREPQDPDNPSSRPTDPVVEGGTLGTTPTDEWEREHPTDPDGEGEPYEKPKPGTPFTPTKPWEEIEDELISTPPASDPDMPPVLPASPKLEDDEAGPADVKVAKTAENLTRDDGTTAVGDTVRYTVTLSNSGPHTMWYGAVVRDVLPLGVDPLSGTIRLTAPDGSEREVPDSAYDPATRVLAVTAGDLAGGRTAVLTFECEVTAEAVGADIGNVASAHGTTPAGVDLGTVGEGAERPAPGEPFDPSEGWDAFLKEHPGMDNAGEPAYAPGTDSSGGVLAEAPGPDGSGSDDGSGSGDGSGKTRIRLAQTGDDMLAAAIPLALAALAAGAVVVALVARRQRWDKKSIR